MQIVAGFIGKEVLLLNSIGDCGVVVYSYFINTTVNRIRHISRIGLCRNAVCLTRLQKDALSLSLR